MIRGSWYRHPVLAALIALAAVLGVIGVEAADDRRPAVPAAFGAGMVLVMVDDAGCVYCRRWDEDIGYVYGRTPPGRMAPLERRRMRHPDLVPYEPLAYTPTFVLVEDGSEIGRIVGYGGADFFWGELERLIAKAEARRPAPAPRSRGPAERNTTIERPEGTSVASGGAIPERGRW
jgi:hypothetical protein